MLDIEHRITNIESGMGADIRMEPSSQRRLDEPQHLSSVLSELFMRRGYGRMQAERQLQEIWRQIAGVAIAARTKVHSVKNGILHVTVANSSLLQELEGFHKSSLLQRLTSEHSDLRIRDLRFRLQSAQTTDAPSAANPRAR